MQYNSREKFKEEIYQYMGNPNTLILHSLSGISYPDPTYEMKRKNSELYSIEYIYEGEGAIQQNDKIYKVSAGDFFILHSKAYHHYFSSPKNPWKKIFFTVDGDPEYILALLKLYKIEDLVYLPQVYNPNKLEQIFDLVKNDDGNIHRKLENLVFSMFGEIADAYRKLDYDLSKASQAKRYIDKRITAKITVAEISDYLCINSSYFSRLFEKEFGMSPIQYILKEKIEQSKYLLANSSITIQDIATHYSFASKSHYIRTFIKYSGMSPDNYRKTKKSEF